MEKLIFQSCDSKECFLIEKNDVGAKNIDHISRRHIYNDETNIITCTVCNISYNLNDIILQEQKDLKKLVRAEKKMLNNSKSGQVAVDIKKTIVLEVSGYESEHKIINNNVAEEQKVMAESVIEVKKSRGRPKKI
jgi:hypothetical protein